MRNLLTIAALTSLIAASLTACAAESTGEHESLLGEPCPEFLGDCVLGEAPTDSDANGCIDGCAPVACLDEPLACDATRTRADLDGDGCALECAAQGCLEFLGDCVAGQGPVDSDADGCIDGCAPMQ